MGNTSGCPACEDTSYPTPTLLNIHVEVARETRTLPALEAINTIAMVRDHHHAEIARWKGEREILHTESHRQREEIARLRAALEEHHKSRPHPESAQCLPCLRGTARLPGPFQHEAAAATTARGRSPRC